MSVKCKKNKIIDLVKMNLTLCNTLKKINLSIIVFSIGIYIITSKLVEFSHNNNININVWDGIFRVVGYNSIILGFYFPFIVLLTTLFNTKNDYLKFILLRTNKKSKWIISKIITNIIFSFLFTFILFAVLFIINSFMLKFEYGWSEIILNKDSLKLVNQLYVNFFVYELNPIGALLISFTEIFISSLIVLNLKDIFVNYIKQISISYSMISAYLILNIICNGYALNEGIFKINEYIGLDTMSLIWKHNFEGYNYFSTTLGMSIIISLVFLFVIIFIDLLFSRKLVIEND